MRQRHPLVQSTRRASALAVLLWIAACGGRATLPIDASMGPDPTLPPPETSTIPVVNIAPAERWRDGEAPRPGAGLAVNRFADGLDHPRWLYVLPNGDVLVAETNAPRQADGGGGVRAWFMERFKKEAGGAVPSADRITLLRDADGDGVAEVRTTFLDDLHSPFGMALAGDALFVANTNTVVRFPYEPGTTRITAPGATIAHLPAGERNRHWTRSLIASPDGTKLYVGVGSDSNVAENGMDTEDGRAAIWEIDVASGEHRLYATGLRNPVGMAWEPETGALWVAVNERDELGGDLVPDYMTAVREGGFYGWPYSYFGDHVDTRMEPQRPELVATAIVPDYALGAHTASLGLAAAHGTTLPDPFRSGMFVGQHGSWNRRPLSGYRVIFVPFVEGVPADDPIDVLTGFLSADDEARGRPVGVAIDGRGALLVADDVGNVIWRVTAARR
jgi:glucose/arabinose dehydrogenase